MSSDTQPPSVFDPAWTVGGWVHRRTKKNLTGGQANLLADGNAHRVALWVLGSMTSSAYLGFDAALDANGSIIITPVGGKGMYELDWSTHGGAVQLPIYIYPNDFGSISWTITEILWLPKGIQ